MKTSKYYRSFSILLRDAGGKPRSVKCYQNVGLFKYSPDQLKIHIAVT